MEKTIRFACSLDCFDSCSLIATVKNNKIIKISGDKNHPITNGHICSKGRKHLERLYHPKRIINPKKKIRDKWIDITWDDAINEISDNLINVKKKYGSQAVLHHSYSGSNGMLKTINEVFFNYFGGVTQHTGSLCLGAGNSAQNYDFGKSIAHVPNDLINSNTIILWGKNSCDTQMHMIQYLKKARQNGAVIILIDPIKTATARFADHHISINPGTDGALALGMAQYIIKNKLHNPDYIKNNVIGFDDYKQHVKDFTSKKVEKITGIKKETVEWLAKQYASCKPSSIQIGYGLQRYKNGGNTVRCIDSLGAITGNIGIIGGGVNYMNVSFSDYIGGELKKSYRFAKNKRFYNIIRLAEFILKAKKPPIKTVFIIKANPLVQNPNINKTIQALKTVDFKVVIDMFMTDSAQYANIILPCTSICEENDFIYNSGYSPYLNYSQKVVDAPKGVMSEYDFFRKLAQTIGITEYPQKSKEDYLKDLLEPLTKKFSLEFNTIKNSYFKIPNSEIPWKTGSFATPSGKFELYSKKAASKGQEPLPTFIEPSYPDQQYPLRLLSPHSKNSLHSQHFLNVDNCTKAYINEKTRKKYAISGSHAFITSKNGQLKVCIEIDENIYDNIVLINEGWWHKSGSVNILTDEIETDMGKTAAYNECFCSISPV